MLGAGCRVDDEAPVFVARAPGRLDVMGGIADYSGALVLQWPIREATRVAVRPWRERRISIVVDRPGGVTRVAATCRSTLVADGERPYDEVRAWFAADPTRHWAAYVAGVFHVLAREHGVRFDGGAADPRRVRRAGRQGRQLVGGDRGRDDGGGASRRGRCTIEPRLRALRCQQVENLIVGAPCGVMDQMAAICGEAGSLMALLCQPAEFQGSIRLPDGLGVWGIDSGIRHAVTGADYGAVRVGAFMGYRVLAELAGLRVTPAIVKGTCGSTIRAGMATSPTWAERLPRDSRRTFPREPRRRMLPRALSGDDRSRDARRSLAALRGPDADGASGPRARARHGMGAATADSEPGSRVASAR